MKSIMTKAELLKMLEPLSDTDIVQCQVNYTTSRTEKAYSQYKNSTEVVPITGMTMQEIPKGSKSAYLQVNVEID